MQPAGVREITLLSFVYDADSGRLATVVDSLLKLLKRGCRLCAVTHGLTGKRPEFLRFERSVGVPVTLLHRNEALGAPRTRDLMLPCIFAEVSGSERPVVLLGPDAILQLTGSESDLLERLEASAAARGLAFPKTRDERSVDAD